MPNVAIIGGGAGGMAAAIMLKRARPELEIMLFERLERVGKKLSTTGNGRCNISNRDLSLNHFYSDNIDTVKSVLESFPLNKTEEFFASLGIVFKEENGGKLYPYSLQASSVVDALRFELGRLDIPVVFGTSVASVKKEKNGFKLIFEDGGYTSSALVVATGGMAGGKIATDLGYKLLKDLSHTVTELTPSIVQLKCENENLRALKGNKTDAAVSLKRGEKTIATDFGEVLFCDYGLSGPPILQLSGKAKKGDIISLDLMPEFEPSALFTLLSARHNTFKKEPLQNYFCGLLKSRIGLAVIKSCGYNINATAESYPDFLNTVCEKIKDMRFTVAGKNGFANAQVTKGGAALLEFDRLLMSKKIKGLFALGEVLNVDGDCGGYNLQWAWSSANAVSRGIEKYLFGGDRK